MKKFMTTMVSAAMLACIAPATPVFAAEITSCEFILTANKSSIHPGDTVNFTLSLKPNGDLYGFEATLVLPEGLTIVSDSAKLTDEAKTKLDWDVPPDISITNKIVFNGTTIDKAPYKDAAEINIATFSCTAAAGFQGGEVSLLGGDDLIAINNEMAAVLNVSVKAATITTPILTNVPAKAPTCKEAGNNEYYKCSDNCGRVYKADGTTATTVATETLAKTTTHDFTDEVVDAKYLSTVATCKTPAKYFKSCTVCGEKGTETFENGIADPTKHGSNTEIRDNVEATCTVDGYSGDTYCTDCGTKIRNGETVTAGHKGGTATCSAKAECEVCGEEYGDFAPDNHVNTEIRNAKAATEDEEGYTGDTYCLDCDTVTVAGNTIPKLQPTNPTPTTPTPTTPTPPSGTGTATFPSSSDSSSTSSSTSTSDPANNSSSTGTTSSDSGSSSNNTSSNTGANTNDNKPSANPSTGITVTVIPMAIAAGAAVIIAKNKKK